MNNSKQPNNQKNKQINYQIPIHTDESICKRPNCNDKVFRKGLCQYHYRYEHAESK